MMISWILLDAYIFCDLESKGQQTVYKVNIKYPALWATVLVLISIALVKYIGKESFIWLTIPRYSLSFQGPHGRNSSSHTPQSRAKEISTALLALSQLALLFHSIEALT